MRLTLNAASQHEVRSADTPPEEKTGMTEPSGTPAGDKEPSRAVDSSHEAGGDRLGAAAAKDDSNKAHPETSELLTSVAVPALVPEAVAEVDADVLPKSRQARRQRRKLDAAVAKIKRGKDEPSTPAAAEAPPTRAKQKRGKIAVVRARLTQVKEPTVMITQANEKFTELKSIVAEAQAKAKSAYDSGAAAAGKLTDVAKANADALVESGKVVSGGLKEIGENALADTRQTLSTFGDDLKELAAIKSPGDILQLQGKLAGRNVDLALGYAAKNTQAFRNLAVAAFAPLSGRAKANIEAVRSLA